MKYFVYYSDGPQDIVDLEEFDSEAQAVAFIEKTIAANPVGTTLAMFKLIRGESLQLKAVASVTKIKVLGPCT